MEDLLINLWDRVTVYCLNHKEPVEMQIVQNTEKIKTPFYACTERDASHCANRLNLDDYKGIVMRFADIVSKEGIATDFSNFNFNYRGARQKIRIKILKYTDKEIRLGIKNLTILGA